MLRCKQNSEIGSSGATQLMIPSRRFDLGSDP